jgi:hypothetical protein
MLTSFSVREMQMKTTVRYHLILLKMTTIQKQKRIKKKGITGAGENME